MSRTWHAYDLKVSQHVPDSDLMPFFSASSAMEGQNCSHMEGTQMDTGMLGLASSSMEVTS